MQVKSSERNVLNASRTTLMISGWLPMRSKMSWRSSSMVRSGPG